jgi:CHAT domain-containing protein
MRGTWAAAFVLVGLALVPAAAAAQVLDYQIRAPAERAALALPPDVRAPTPDEAARIAALEAEVRHDQPCNTTWQKDREAPRRALLALYEATYGPDHPATARPLQSLICHLFYNARTDPEALRLADRLVAIGTQRRQPLFAYAGLAARLTFAANVTGMAGAMDDAQAKTALALALFGSDSSEYASSRRAIGSVLQTQGRLAEADQYLFDYIAWRERHTASDAFGLASLYENMGDHLAQQMRRDEATAWFRRAIDVYERALPTADDRQLGDIAAYAQRLYWHAPERIEALYRAILARQEAHPDSSDGRNWMTLWNLSKAAGHQGRREEAIGLLRRVIDAVGPGPGNDRLLELADLLGADAANARLAAALYNRALLDDPDNPALLEKLSGALRMQGKHDEAIPLAARAVRLSAARSGPSHRETLRLMLNHARQLWMTASMAQAAPYYEQTLAGYRTELAALPASAAQEYRKGLRDWIGTVSSELLKLYWFDRENPATADRALRRDRAFEIAQLAHPSSAAEAISESAAAALARRRGAGALFDAWTRARDELAALDEAIATASADAARDLAALEPLVTARPARLVAAEAAAAALRKAVPDLLGVLQPEPVSRTALTGHGGLLRADEALVLLYPGYPEARGSMSRGTVFAVTRDSAAWAEIPLDGADLTAAVSELRFQLGDNTGRDLRFVPRAGETATGEDNDPRGYRRFDRVAAHGLYQALFGDPAIAPLLADKSRWVLVPQGPLLSLPFAALVTAPPAGGAAGDIDPEALRATRWLGLERVVSILPNVDALRTARSRDLRAGSRASGFFGLGDPAFRGVPDPPATPPTWEITVQPGTMRSFLRSGTGSAASIAKLPRLSHTGREIRAIAQMVGGSPSRTLLQMEATESAIMAADSAGQLRRSRLIVFATHALVAGEIAEAAVEPALALTPDGTEGDGLLTASEIARLDLAAALIILSACNTAAGSEGGEGFSGLVRAFFQAGAGSVVATHVPLLDDAGERLMVTMIGQLPASGRDVAAALRLAMQDVATDPRFDEQGESLAHPRNWAVFAVIDPQ